MEISVSDIARKKVVPVDMKETDRSDSKRSDTSHSSFLSDSSRSTYVGEKIKTNQPLTMKFYEIFGKRKDPRGRFAPVRETDSRNGMKDTETTELSQCEMDDRMKEVNEKVT